MKFSPSQLPSSSQLQFRTEFLNNFAPLAVSQQSPALKDYIFQVENYAFRSQDIINTVSKKQEKIECQAENQRIF